METKTKFGHDKLIPKGYRVLKDHESVSEGDKYFSNFDGRWKDVPITNVALSDKDVFVFMRKVEDTTKIEGGAKREPTVAGHTQNKPIPRYDLISPNIIEALAETYGEGAIKYGDDNWKKGLSKANLLNHALAHIIAYMKGDTSEPHLEHAIWNLGTQIHFDREGENHG